MKKFKLKIERKDKMTLESEILASDFTEAMRAIMPLITGTDKYRRVEIRKIQEG